MNQPLDSSMPAPYVNHIKQTPADEAVKYRVPGLEKGLRLLLELGRQHGELSFAQICQRLELPKSTTFRTLHTLEQMGFIQRNPSSGNYGLGIGVLRLGFDYLSSMDFVQFGQPIIQRLCNQLGASTHLTIRDGREVLYVARVAAAGEITAGVSIGTRLPVHRTGLGRALLLAHSKADFAALYPEPRFTPPPLAGPQTPAELWALIEHDRELGYVITESFYQTGISSVVYPLHDTEGRVVAAISAMMPVPQLASSEQRRLREAVAQAASEIEAFLRASPNPPPYASP